MRVDSTNGSIHDLTTDEALSLRILCEGMVHGPVDLTHQLFIQWVDAMYPAHDKPATLLTVVFLSKALHALLVRAEHRLANEMGVVEKGAG